MFFLVYFWYNKVMCMGRGYEWAWEGVDRVGVIDD